MRDDVGSVYTTVHQRVIVELLHLLDGFFVNLEYGLFELADRLDDDDVRTGAFNLMREMRYKRPQLLRMFTRLVEADQAWWTESRSGSDGDGALYRHAQLMAQNCEAHFGPLLQTIAARTAHATERGVVDVQLPISPVRLTYNFLRSCRLLEPDRVLGTMVDDLFGRFVLDRLGTVYGRCSASLEAAGYLADPEAGHSAVA